MKESTRKLRVAVLFGSRSVEHEVSIITAIQAMDAMDPRRYEPVPIFITKEGRWASGPELRRIDAYKDLSGLLARCRPVFMRPEPYGGRLFVNCSRFDAHVFLPRAVVSGRWRPGSGRGAGRSG